MSDQPSKQTRWPQFSLRFMLIAVALVAGVICAVKWYDTRHMWRLNHAIQASNLGTEDKRLLGALAWNKSAWKSGLITHLCFPQGLKRITWSSTFQNARGQTIYVYLLDSYIRPVADMPVPPVYIATDDKYTVLCWSSVGELSKGVISAELFSDQAGHELKITSVANWFAGQGTYRYRITESDITEIGEPKFSKFDKNGAVLGLLPLHPQPREIVEALKSL
jgi:hypothetical protein